MRIIGIDPGTGSFDFFGMDGEKVILDTSVPVPEVGQNPKVLVDTVRGVFPLDMIVGPSGYGLPVTPIRDVTERELTLMVPDDKSIPLYDGIRMVIRLMKKEGFPVYFTPGVKLTGKPSFFINLITILMPSYSGILLSSGTIKVSSLSVISLIGVTGRP